MEQQLRSILEGYTESALEFNDKWTNPHLLFFGSLSENWNDYINYLDMRVTTLVSLNPD